MKFNKKLLALLLSLSVIFTSFGVMAETPVTTTAATAAREIPIESAEYDILQALGYIGEDIKILNGDSAFTRAQFIGTLFKVAGFPAVEYAAEDLTFADVTETTAYKDEIQYFYNAGYINGTSAYEFSPNNHVTYQQAAKIIVDLLGYKDFAINRYGNDMNAFVSMAQKLDLTHNMAIGNVAAPLTAQNAIIMLYNAGRTKVFEASYYESTGDIVYNSWNGPELFEKNSNIYYGTGLMQSNGLVSILSSNPNESFARISGVDYLLSDVDLTGLVGLNVEFHYKKENGTKTLIWAGLKDNSSMLEIQAADLDTGDARYDMDTIVYRKNNKGIVANLDSYCNVIYNNSLYNSYNLTHIQPEMGFIRLVDSDNDKDYDLVIVEEYQNIFVINKASGLAYVSDKYNNPIKFEDYENVKVYKDGKEGSQDDIVLNTVLTCVADVNKKNLVVYVNTEVYKTKLISYTEEAGKVILEFEELTTQFAPSYLSLDPAKYNIIDPRPGRLYTIYLDKEGNIAEIQENPDGVLEYAYVIKAMPNDERNAEPNSAVFRLLLESGNFVNATTKKKIKLNGVPNKTGQDILNTPQLWRNVLDGGGNVIGTEIDEQVVRVTLNEEGEITEFEFAYDNRNDTGYGFDETKFSLDYEGTGGYGDSNNGYMIASRYMTDGTTKLFIKYDGVDLEEPYAVISHTAFRKVSGTTVRVYDSNSARLARVVTGVHNAVSYNTMYAFLVDSIVYKKIDGETVKCIAGWYGAAWKEMPEYSEGVIPNTIKRGDLLSVSQMDNKITKVEYINSLADRPAPFFSGRNLFSYFYSMSTSTLCVLTPAGNEATYGAIFPSWIKSTKVAITVYDVKNDDMYVTTIEDVAPFKAPDATGAFTPEASDVMVYMNRYDSGNYVTDIIVVLY